MSVCKQCPYERTPTCHSTCPDYARERERRESEYRERKFAIFATDIILDGVRKQRKGLKK